MISDWGAVHDTRTAVTGGVDMEFGSWTDGLTEGTSNAHDNYYLAEPYLEGIQSGEFTTAGIDELGNEVMDIPYNEGIFVGYRFIDKNKLKPTFPFGHGLSYTSYEYGKATIDTDKMSADGKVVVTVPVTNTGNRTGAEVVQLYISDVKSSLPRPVKELKDFAKVTIEPGQTVEVKFEITPDKLAFFDDNKHEWIVEPGDFIALVGASSADIKSQVKFKYF